mmetsp:Transcript_5501/g.18180  ORF Transcript_5501/g.18180 Transcript_5501/m.18180 type:complete len:301 (+) Transcript_5501:429-1331(+)
MCRIEEPSSVGLNGAKAPYGLGMPTISSGMYALGRGSAVVCVRMAGALSCNTLLLSSASRLRCMSYWYRAHSLSTCSDGGSPRPKLASCSPSSASLSAFSWVSFIAVAWYMDSSDTVAIIRRVVPLIFPWNSLTRLDNSTASSRPSTACARSRLARLVTSSSTNSFSSSCSFLSLSRSSSTCSLAARSSGSGSLPSSRRHRLVRSGISSSPVNLFASSCSSANLDCSRTTSSSSSGIRGSFRRVTSVARHSSATRRSSARVSSSRFRISASPFRSVACCMFDFSYRMHSSSFRSMSWMPV